MENEEWHTDGPIVGVDADTVHKDFVRDCVRHTDGVGDETGVCVWDFYFFEMGGREKGREIG